MICVSIGRGRHQQMIAEHKKLAEDGVQLVELRLDYIRRQVNVKRLLYDHPCPAIVTCRRESDGGQWKDSEESRIMLLRTAIAEGVDFVDLEADVAGNVPRFGKTKRIISYHDFVKTPVDLEALHQKLCKLDPDIIKIATMANNPHDNVRMLKLVASSETPTVGICMGEMGIPSRVLAGKYGAPFTFATYHQERTMAPGQLSNVAMRDIYNYDKIDADTELYGVIGDPIAHSLSPVIHNASFQALGQNKVYLPFRVSAEGLDQFMDDARSLGVRGLSVTIPHKEGVLSHCTKIDGAVKGIGAANTLIIQGDEILGYNTDYRAAMSCLDACIGANRKSPLAGHTAMVLGSGGVARAVAFGLIRRGADVVITSRTEGRAEQLAAELKCRSVAWKNRHKLKVEVLVNGTPVGMHPNVNETPFDGHYLRPNTVVFDTVYNPEQTLLFKEAQQRRCQVVSGLEMFIGQAALQVRYFADADPPVDVMRESLKRAIGAARY